MAGSPDSPANDPAPYDQPNAAEGIPADKFPALDVPGAEGLEGLERVRVEPRFTRLRSDTTGAAGTLEVYTLGDCSVGCCYLVLECVEQSELFPAVCNTWQLVWIGGSC